MVKSWFYRRNNSNIHVSSLILVSAISSTLILAGPAQVMAQPNYGDLLVVDSGGNLFRVDPSTGNSTIITNFRDSSYGPTGDAPEGLAIDSSGNILTIARLHDAESSGALFTVNPTSGKREVISNFSDSSQGPLGANPSALAIDSSGNVLVINSGVGPFDNDGILFSVDPVTGHRTIVSDFANSTQGPLGANPFALAIDSSGNVLVLDIGGYWTEHSILFKVDPITGHRTIVSDFKNPAQGPIGHHPTDLATNASGNIIVVDFGAQYGPTGYLGPDGALFRVDPISGNRTLITDFSDISQGPLGDVPYAVDVDPSGTIFVADSNVGLFSVDPISGNRTLITDFGGDFVYPDDVQAFLIQPDTAPGLVSIPSTINKAGDNTAIRLCAGSHKLHVTDAEITDPTGASFFDAFGEFDMAANQCVTWNTGIDFPGFSTNELGTYAVQISTDRGIFASDFSVPLFMIPESPIGIIALMGSFLAALGGFIVLRRRQGNSEHSIGDLGI